MNNKYYRNFTTYHKLRFIKLENTVTAKLYDYRKINNRHVSMNADS